MRFHLATACVQGGCSAEAIRVLQRSLARNREEPNTNIALATAYSLAGGTTTRKSKRNLFVSTSHGCPATILEHSCNARSSVKECAISYGTQGCRAQCYLLNSPRPGHDPTHDRERVIAFICRHAG